MSKIGEGTFGEAFKGPATVRGQTCSTVFKIVPMEGATLVNGEKQKTADEMLAEVAVTLRWGAAASGTPHRSLTLPPLAPLRLVSTAVPG